ncbi:SURF1 family protein [Massilia yuzhufengensis]|uniref:SURF1-like protein n=1 Tax=Massilia yuzhufengensis TaxID=1164594 RepID=A0A1I1W134_9BURK|nr:SURF1 family protein [Massilia yuzhufengensis]SFD88864.1 Cytochrome oxidase assembly protein ShyY1 [Massilia yuzhufengensis]
MRFAFHFRPIPFIAALALALLGIALGNWQQGRAAHKQAVQEQLTARAAEPPVALGPAITPAGALEYRRVTVTGEFVAGWPLFLANRPMAGRPGYVLMMPFRIAGSNTHVLVLRGWLPRQAEYGKLPAFATPSGTVTIEGTVAASAGHVMDLGEAAALAPNAIVQNIDPAAAGKATGLALQPFFVQQTGPEVPGSALLRVWPSPSSGIDKHRGYAFQWYALAAMAILFFVITGFRSGSRKHGPSKSN